MLFQQIDWLIIASYFLVSLTIGVVVARRAGKDSTEFFAAGKGMPWWLLGISMVATTFSTDTPNLVSDIVRQHGVSGNWLWWAFLLTGMLTVFVYAKLWKRSEILTDIEFYELRYSGRGAAFLRGFRALYLGFFFNVVIMATVSLAAIKIGSVLLGLKPLETILMGSLITVVYSVLGGLRGVLFTDFVQFFMSIGGGIAAAIVAINHPDVGGLGELLGHEAVRPRLSVLPSFDDPTLLWSVFLIPIMVQWWSVWYPGAEPGGGGYIAQRMLSAKNEKHAVGAVFLFNFAHYAIRPWPWIIVALASIIVFPDLQALTEAFPASAGVVKHDLAYPAMLTFMPAGLLGLVVASLIAAYMSTISTHLNWGSSYIVHDFYRRFVKPDSTEKHLVAVGRISTVLLMIVAGILALLMKNALDSFQILLQIGAGTGLIFILRWFWWRINSWSEITAMVVSFLVAVYFQFVHENIGLDPINPSLRLVIGVFFTSLCWLTVALLTRPAKIEVLESFYRKVQPGGPGWKKLLDILEQQGRGIKAEKARQWDVPTGMLGMFLGCTGIYSALFAIGYWIYGDMGLGILLTVLSLLSFGLLIRVGPKFRIIS